MKTLLLTLGLLTLLCCLSCITAGPIGPQLLLGSCCEQNKNITVPKVKVKELKMTPSHCKLRSVIVLTEKKKFCLDPDWSWTQELQKTWNNQKDISKSSQKL